MRLQRYSMGEYNCYYEDDEEGDVCKSWEVECLEALNAKLEAINAELLDALEQLQPYVLHLPDGALIKEIIRSAIAKAKGEQP